MDTEQGVSIGINIFLYCSNPLGFTFMIQFQKPVAIPDVLHVLQLWQLHFQSKQQVESYKTGKITTHFTHISDERDDLAGVKGTEKWTHLGIPVLVAKWI